MDGTDHKPNRFFDPDSLVTAAARYFCTINLIVQAVYKGYVQEDWETVVEMMEAAAQLGELDNHSRLLLAKAHLETGNYDASLRELIFLSSNDPWCGTTQQMLGEVRLHKKRYKEAARSFSSAITIKAMTNIIPAETVSYLGRAMSFTLMGRHSAAKTDMQTYAALSILKKARMHFWSGRFAQCADIIDNLPARQKELPSMQYLKIRNIMATRDYEKALQEFPKVISVSHVGLPILYCRALCNHKTKNLQACINDLTRITSLASRVVLLELNPVSSEVDIVEISQVYSLRADCNKELKNYSAALEDYERTIYLNPSPEVYLARAQVLYGLGLIARALSDVETAERELSDEQELQSLKMLCLARLGRHEEATTIATAMLKKLPDSNLAQLTLQVINNSEAFVVPTNLNHSIVN